MNLYFVIFSVSILFYSSRLFSFTEVGLSPSIYAMTKGEALTASAPPSEALFYNPSHLAWKGVNLEFAAAGYVVDEDHAKQGKESVKDKKIDSTKLIGDALTSGRPTLIKNNLEFLNFVFPYFALKSFANARLFSRKIVDENPHQEIDFLARFGLTSGLALSAGHWAFGYSYYLIKQADFLSTPNEAQISAINQAVTDGTLSSSTTNFASFSSMNYGEASGHNFGLTYRSSRDNSSGFGLAVLNAGGTRFRTGKAIIRGKFEEIEQAAKDEATKHGLTLGTPKKIDQMVNLGFHLASDEGKEDYFFASISMDYQDIGGTTLDNRIVMATDFGFRISDNLSLLTSVPIAKHHGMVYYLGLTSIKFLGAYRVNESLSGGLDLKLHLGFNKIVSLIRLNLNGMIIKSLNQQLVPDATGFQIGLGLTFVFPDMS